jgi:hypothetical protein
MKFWGLSKYFEKNVKILVFERGKSGRLAGEPFCGWEDAAVFEQWQKFTIPSWAHLAGGA